MKKLAITSIAVLIALIGFTAVLCLLPGGNCCGDHDRCEMRDGKCPHEKGECGMSEGKCEGKQEGCGQGEGQCHGKEKHIVKEWTDADGKVHREEQVIIEGDNAGMGCPMENGDHSGCCGCCPYKNDGNRDHCDSMKMDSVHIKVRGKL